MKQQLNSIQYLRGIAALLVVICHGFAFRNIIGVTVQEPSESLQYFGAIGVDIFFIISGFIITFTAGSAVGTSAAIEFGKKRFIRIVPVYYIASALYLVRYVSGAIFPFIPPAHVVINKYTILKTITILPLFDKGEPWPTVLTLAWTLSYEFLFYLIFSALILFKFRNRNVWLLGIIIALTLLGTIFPTHNIQWEFSTNYMILEFGFGVLLCLLYKRLQHLNFYLPAIITALSLSAFILLILFGNKEIAGYGLELFGFTPIYRVILWGIPSALFVFGIVFMEKAKPGLMKGNKTMLLLGNASYSVYLTHGLTFMAMGLLLNHFTFLKHLLPQDLFLIICIALALITGVLFYKYVEKPLLTLLNLLLLKPKNKTILKP